MLKIVAKKKAQQGTVRLVKVTKKGKKGKKEKQVVRMIQIPSPSLSPQCSHCPSYWSPFGMASNGYRLLKPRVTQEVAIEVPTSGVIIYGGYT